VKTIITALNSKFIHLSLAPWYLKEACRDISGEIKVMEFTINDEINSILSLLIAEKADIYAFSCYIWNIEYVIKLSSDIKKVMPKSKIVLGGPEVSFNADEILNDHDFIDCVISGEGEKPFRHLLEVISQKKEACVIPGLSFRDENAIQIVNSYNVEHSLDDVPFPYTEEMINEAKNKIIYYEASRGCPFSCSYCLSSTCSGVRYLNFERVKSELTWLLKKDIGQIKFVDRTFNANKKRAKEIFKFVIENCREGINFHFEAAGDLFDDEMLEILQSAPAGLIQFEIGIQSTNPETLLAVNRKTDIDRVFSNIARLLKPGNIHVHVDLIAGLPYETYELFKKSFNDVYNLSAHNLQLGFLKLLKGSGLRKDAEKYGIIYRDYPPYEILSNNFITFDELAKLKNIEEVLERYYNSGRFAESLKYLTGRLYKTPFDFYYDFSVYLRETGQLDRPATLQSMYDSLFSFIENEFSKAHGEILKDLMRFDFLRAFPAGKMPEKINKITDMAFHNKCFDFLRNEKNIHTYLPAYKGCPAKQIYKNVHFELFDYDIFSFDLKRNVILFDYKEKNKVTGLYNYHVLENSLS